MLWVLLLHARLMWPRADEVFDVPPHLAAETNRPIVDGRIPDVRTTRSRMNVLSGTYSTLVAPGHRLAVAEWTEEWTDVQRRADANGSLRMREGGKKNERWRQEEGAMFIR